MRKLAQNRSAQVLILTALAIALIISSTIVYVYQTSQSLGRGHPFSPEDFVRMVKLGSRNLMIGSLANISWGGDNQTLETNLQRWVSFVEKEYYFGECSLSFELCETPPYSSGLRVWWGTQGFGVTSAEADFFLNLTSKYAEITVSYPVNVTTSMSVYATSQILHIPSEPQMINVTVTMYNEGEPAFARDIIIFYYTQRGWENAGLLGSYSLTDYGNGTCMASFIVDPPKRWQRQISVESYDQREIYVQAMTQCVDV